MIIAGVALTWDKVKAVCFRSMTIAAGYLSLAGSAFLDNIDGIATALHDPELSTQIASLVGGHPALAAGYAKFFGFLMIATRLRGIVLRRR